MDLLRIPARGTTDGGGIDNASASCLDMGGPRSILFLLGLLIVADSAAEVYPSSSYSEGEGISLVPKADVVREIGSKVG